MPAPLPTPRVPPGFSSLTAACDQTSSPGDQTARATETGGSTASPGGQTARRTGAGGPTASPGGQTAHGTGPGGPTTSPGDQTARGTGAGGPTARPCAAPPSPASPTSTVYRAPPATSAVPHAAPTTPVASPVAPASQLYPLHYSRRPRATREPPAPPLHQQSPPAKAAPMAPPINPHPITMRAKRGFRPTDSPYRPLRRQPCHRCPPPSAPPSSIQIGAAPWKKNLLP
jgi:hypothetical protein